VKEANHIWAALAHENWLVGGASRGHILHGHQDLIDAGDVFLYLRDVMLKDSHLNAFSTSQALHDGTILVSDVLLDHILEGLNLVDSVI
jgi:hypothetical protein